LKEVEDLFQVSDKMAHEEVAVRELWLRFGPEKVNFEKLKEMIEEKETNEIRPF